MGGLNNPNINKSRPLKDVIPEGSTFVLDGIRTVEVTTDYGPGKMVLLKLRNQSDELSLWGAYVVAQAESVTEADLGKHYKVVRKTVPEFSKREVKALQLWDPETDTEIPF